MACLRAMSWLLFAVALLAYATPSLASRPCMELAGHDCNYSSSTPDIDATTGALLEIYKLYEQNRSEREASAHERQLDRERTREAQRAQWEREYDAEQAAWKRQHQANAEYLAATRKQFDGTLDRMRANQATRSGKPRFLHRDGRHDILLGFDEVRDHAGGVSFLRDQNGDDVGNFRLNTRRSDDGKYLDVEFHVSNHSDCKMLFNGFFKKGDRVYDLLSFGNGAELEAGGRRVIRDRIVIGGGSQPAAHHRFQPDVNFIQCGRQG